jgi:hypothetical protein
MGAPTDALVTDADQPGAVAGLRALARAGHGAIALGPDAWAAGLLARGVAGRAVGPDAITDPTGFAARVGELARAHGPVVVYPAREGSIDALTSAALPAEAILPFPGPEVLGPLRDKASLPRLAAAGGLRAPDTIVEGTPGELVRLPVDRPVVVKARDCGPELLDVTVARTPSQLVELLAAAPPNARLILQELAEGPLVCLALVVDRDGRLVERFQQRSLRQWPLDAGPSTVAVSVAPDDELFAAATAMLAASGFWGLAQLDFLMTPDGPRLIDVNPRFYTSLGLALASGVNLPAAWHAVTTGTGRWTPTAYRTGVGYRRLEADVAAAVRGHPLLLGSRPRRPRIGSVWSSADPLPGVVYGARRIAGWSRKRLPGGS